MSDTLYEPGSTMEDVAVFPLPQVVLFPGALMPLHIFEPRYRTMIRDVLASTRRICIAQISLVDRDHGLALLSLAAKNSTLPFRKVDNGSLERPTKLTLRLASRRTRHCPRKCAPGSRSPDRPLTFGTGLPQHYLTT